jgi:hypothetical protein
LYENHWGILAKSPGIKPGLKEFHALKRRQDLYDSSGMSKRKGNIKINPQHDGSLISRGPIAVPEPATMLLFGLADVIGLRNKIQ